VCISTRWRGWLKYHAESQKVAVSIPDGVIGIFYCHNPSGPAMTLRSTQPLTEMSKKVKVIPQQTEVALGVPGRLRPRIFLTFGTTRVVGRQPYAPTGFTPGEIPGTRPQGTLFRREPRKKSPVIPPGIDPGPSRLVAQCLNHYAASGR
jgi:hypothetical protein